MIVFELGGGKQIVVGNGRVKIWANRGCIGVDLTPAQQQEIGLTMYQLGRRAAREKRP